MENLNNLPPFYVGQKVICKDNSPNVLTGTVSLELNKTYTISAIHGKGYVKVKEVELPSSCYFFSKRFSPKENTSYPLISLTKVLEEQKQLLAAN